MNWFAKWYAAGICGTYLFMNEKKIQIFYWFLKMYNINFYYNSKQNPQIIWVMLFFAQLYDTAQYIIQLNPKNIILKWNKNLKIQKTSWNYVIHSYVICPVENRTEFKKQQLRIFFSSRKWKFITIIKYPTSKDNNLNKKYEIMHELF